MAEFWHPTSLAKIGSSLADGHRLRCSRMIGTAQPGSGTVRRPAADFGNGLNWVRPPGRGAGSRVRLHGAGDVSVRGQAVAALARLTGLLAELGLQPKPAKTRIVQLSVDGGADFLGFHHQAEHRR